MDDARSAHDADARYQPLGGTRPWAAVQVDGAAWDHAMARLRGLARADQQWLDMVRRGAMLAAAHQSGALDGMHPGDRDVALALLHGAASPALVDAHSRANYEALRLATTTISEPWLRQAHQVACRPQLMHGDHVLGHGDYKHHPNHVRGPDGTWRAFAPVADVRAEMARFVKLAGSDGFARLHPVARAAFAHHAVLHVRPFADGNGRVARVVASVALLASISLPLLVFADEAPAYDAMVAGGPADIVAFVEQCCTRLVDLLVEMRRRASPEQAAALDRWRRRAAATAALGGLLPDAVARALQRHRGRTDLGWLSPLAHATVTPGEPLVITEASVDEVLRVDAQPLDGSSPGPVLRADHARLHLDFGPEELLPAPSPAAVARLEPWLDRVVSTLALRVAAEAD